MLTRRDLLRLGGTATALALIPGPVFAMVSERSGAGPRLFFGPADVPRIRATAASPMLHPTMDRWAVGGLSAARDALAKASETGNMYRDARAAFTALRQQAIVQILDPEPRREALLLDGLDQMLGMERWDYLYDGDTPIGMLVAPVAIDTVVLLREVLGQAIPAAKDAQLLLDIAEKGCAPCARTLAGMEDPQSVVGWHPDELHSTLFDIDYSNWPVILATTNLRAVPLASLGTGALALRGHDERADAWCDQAVRNARFMLSLFYPDGTYTEGVGYASATIRHLFGFMEAHQRADGSIQWADEANLAGMIRYILTLQAGIKPDGTPDVVNFSDAGRSSFFAAPAWIARQLEGTPEAGIAQFTVERASSSGSFLDVLWVDPDRPLAFPPDSYHNVRLDNDWIACRTGWAADDSVLAFRSGGPSNHEHADRNSVFFKAYGERLLTDHPGASYDWRQPKWRLRLTEAHNAVLVDGQGHQYHNGEEGTNPSLAEAKTVCFVDDGDRVWWSSDATSAYALVHGAVTLVRRTVLFAKPDIVVLLDEIEATAPVTASARFFPDNEDGKAAVEIGTSSFIINRPHASLMGESFSAQTLDVASNELDLDAEWGVYPYIEIRSTSARTHEFVTVLVARPEGGHAAPSIDAVRGDQGWSITVGDVRAHISVGAGGIPEVEWVNSLLGGC